MAETNVDHDVEKQDGHTQVAAQSGTPATIASPSASQVLLSIEQYRVLVGIPQDSSCRPSTSTKGSLELPRLNGSTVPPISAQAIRRSTITSKTRTKPRILTLLGVLKRPPRKPRGSSDDDCTEVNEYPTSLYYALREEETDQWSQYHLYNFITYTCLVLQLVIASALIVIGALPSSSSGDNTGHRIAIAILGAITGLLTGALSLLKGQGLPNRFLQYASRLREVRVNIEFKDRILRSGASTVSYQDVLDIIDQYEAVLNERDMNRPDTWATQAVPSQKSTRP